MGAAAVDVVDISTGMLAAGEKIEARHPRHQPGVIRFLEADCAAPLTHLPLRAGGYDVVLAGWLFCHAETLAMLEGMFRNIAAHLKPGGRLVAICEGAPRSAAVRTGKYSTTYTRVWDVPGGVKFVYEMVTTPPAAMEACSLDVIQSGSSEIYERFGLEDVKTVPYESCEVVRKDPAFWEMMLAEPNIVCRTAVKRKDV